MYEICSVINQAATRSIRLTFDQKYGFSHIIVSHGTIITGYFHHTQIMGIFIVMNPLDLRKIYLKIAGSLTSRQKAVLMLTHLISLYE